MNERMKKFLEDYANYIQSDEANTDDFLVEGMTFAECNKLMDHVAHAVREYVRKHTT